MSHIREKIHKCLNDHPLCFKVISELLTLAIGVFSALYVDQLSKINQKTLINYLDNTNLYISVACILPKALLEILYSSANKASRTKRILEDPVLREHYEPVLKKLGDATIASIEINVNLKKKIRDVERYQKHLFKL